MRILLRRDEMLMESLLPAARVWHVNDLCAKLALIRAGMGWGYMPCHRVEEDLRQGTLKMLTLEGVRRRNENEILAVLHECRATTATQWLLKRLRETATV